MEKVRLGDVAIEKREAWTGSTQGVPIVGLEHLVPGEVTLSSWDSDTDNTFSKMFRKGQVLLGRRRVYLKKAVIAPFDGICSGDITVIEAIPGKISSRLLPFVIQNNRFFDYAMQGSAGSLSPRVKWEHLKDYEFNLPDYEEQDCLADKLWSALKLRESYQSLLQATDEMVKSRFIEMFGNPNANPKGLPRKHVSELFTLQMGKTPARDTARYWSKDDTGHKWISIADMSNYCYYTADTEERITDDAVKEAGMKLIPSNSVIMSFKLTIGRVAVTSKPIFSNEAIVAFLQNWDVYSTRFLYYLVMFHDWLDNAALAVKGKTLNKESIGKNLLIIPTRESQNAFAAFAEQADKSKFELKQAIEKIDKVMRALMQ